MKFFFDRNRPQRFRRRKDLVTLGVQGLVVDGEGRVLLVRHGYRPGWHFPGGGVEPGETLEHALTRELLEETGVELRARPRLAGFYAHFDVFPGDHIALYHVTRWHQPRIPAPNTEIVAVQFCRVDNLPEDLADGARRRIAEYFSSKPVSDHW